jgi:hypothetical protein
MASTGRDDHQNQPDPSGSGASGPSALAPVSNPGNERSTARSASRKFERIGIVAVVGAFASVGLVCFVLAMRHPVEPSVGRRTAQPASVGATSKSATLAEHASRSTPVTPPPTETSPALATPMLNQPPTTLSDARVVAFLKEVSIWYDRRTEVTSRRDRQSSTPQEALPEHRLREELPHSSRAVIKFPDVGNRKEIRREAGRGYSVD